MKKFLGILLLSLLFFSGVNAACDDPPGDGVDYSGCAFSDGQDLTGTYLPNANLSFTGFIKVIFDDFFIFIYTNSSSYYPYIIWFAIGNNFFYSISFIFISYFF